MRKRYTPSALTSVGFSALMIAISPAARAPSPRRSCARRASPESGHPRARQDGLRLREEKRMLAARGLRRRQPLHRRGVGRRGVSIFTDFVSRLDGDRQRAAEERLRIAERRTSSR